MIAVNKAGDSVVSFNGNGAQILTVPAAPVNLANNNASTTATQIALTWSTSPTNGGSIVIDYKVEYDAGNGNGVYSTLATGVTPLSYIATGLTVGKTYSFKVYARNIVGYSLGSDPVSPAILAAQIPDTPLAPTTTIAGDYVNITWAAPSAQGSPITAYLITVRQSDLTTYTLSLSSCDGST